MNNVVMTSLGMAFARDNPSMSELATISLRFLVHSNTYSFFVLRRIYISLLLPRTDNKNHHSLHSFFLYHYLRYRYLPVFSKLLILALRDTSPLQHSNRIIRKMFSKALIALLAIGAQQAVAHPAFGHDLEGRSDAHHAPVISYADETVSFSLYPCFLSLPLIYPRGLTINT